MNYKKTMILLLSLLTVCISFSTAFGDEIEEYKVRSWDIEKYYLDIDQDGEDETKIVIDREDQEISIGEDEISYDGFLYDILYEDLTDDGNLEIVVATKDEGSSSLLSYRVYRMEDDEFESIFRRRDIYKGVIEVDDGRIIEKMPLYSGDDPNGYPSEYLIREYIYDEGDFELDEEDTKDIEDMDIIDKGSEPSRKYNKYYENPDRDEMEDIIEAVSLDKGIPPVILKAIAYTESGLRQFEDGDPLVSFDGVSYGVMQVTPKVHTAYDEEKLKYDVEYNIEAGADILLSKWNYAFRSNPIIPKVGDGDPRILENWYFAIWAYNGWSESNNPNMIPYDHISWVQRKAYQDKVLDYAEDEFDEEITKIDEDDLPETGLPDEDDDFDTPKPKHKGEYKTYDYGDIIINMAKSGLVLRDDDWDKIETISPRVAMITLAGPEYHNGYVRYKVRTVDEDREDESIGWVAMNWTKSMRDSDVNDDGETDLDDVDEIMDNINEDEDLDILDINYDNEIDEYDALLVEREYEIATICDGFEMLDEQKDVSDSKDWIIKFNQKLDSDTVNNKNIYIEDKSSGEKVETKVKLQSDGKSVKIYAPDEDYISGNTYIIKIDDDVESYKGKELKKPVAMEFVIEF
ncbi:transglycosylase SLT domain-containing protein [Wukongibacter baidiensis]|uniref:Ig-like domain-containing protein n=1 Tax=Wukongibacter baidiensis TaxID=1723361 RepID=UPI003D7F4D83